MNIQILYGLSSTYGMRGDKFLHIYFFISVTDSRKIVLLAKAQVSLLICAAWSGPLLVTYRFIVYSKGEDE